MAVIAFIVLLLAFVLFVGGTFVAWRFDRWPALIAAGLALWVLLDLIQAGQRL